jgi:pimeloyl-ACP methyl ester carboxylesterase
MGVKKQVVLFAFFLILIACAAFEVVPESPVTSIDGVAIDFEIQGKGSPTLVFIHGWSCDKTYWAEQISFFSKKFRTVTIDLPGHGKSGVDRSNWTIEKFGEDVVTIVNKLNLKQVILIGHSMGGPIVIEAALKIPDRVIGIVTVDSGALLNPTKDPSQKFVDGLLKKLRSDFPKTMNIIVKKHIFLPTSDQKLVQKVAADMAAQPPEIGIEVQRGLLEWRMGDDWDSIKKVKAPICFINAERSVPNMNLYKEVPHFKYRLIPNVGHFVMLEDPIAFNQVLLQEIGELIKLAKQKDVVLK